MLEKSSGSSTNSSGNFIKKGLKLVGSAGWIRAEFYHNTSQREVKFVKSLVDKSGDVFIWDVVCNGSN